MILREAFDYPFSRLDPLGDHIDPPSVAIYETLLVKGPDWKGHPMLAERWDVSSDGLEWCVTLRPGLRFHSGASCDAAAVLAALEQLRNHAQPGRKLWYWDPVDTARAADECTIVFRLHHPYSRLPALLGAHTPPCTTRRSGLATTTGRGGPLPTAPGHSALSRSPEQVVAEAWQGYPGALAGFLSLAPSGSRASSGSRSSMNTSGSMRSSAVRWTACTGHLSPRSRGW